MLRDKNNKTYKNRFFIFYMVKYVFGHKNPDTDTVISAILYSNFLNSRGIESKAITLGKINNETKFILEEFEIDTPEIIETLPEKTEVVLVDHNEKKQTISNIDELKINSIIDHHKFSISTSEPLFIRAEPLGSTCSIITKIFEEQNYDISKIEASLLISAIISDTLYFRSPTTTNEDKEIVQRLNEIAEIEDLETYSLEMFNAKSNLGEVSAEEMIKIDYKEFDFNGNKYGIGVMETTNSNFALNKKSEIIKTLKDIKDKDNLNGTIFCIIDILKEENITLIPSEIEANIIKTVFEAKEIEPNMYSLGKIVSRKKQIVPKLETYFNS